MLISWKLHFEEMSEKSYVITNTFNWNGNPDDKLNVSEIR
jgi:hypothetical protein